jgi:hypothetical protein
MQRSTTPRPRHTAGRGLAALAVALLAMSSLVSCRADQVGTAANVDDESISVEELQDATVGYLEAVPDGNAGDAQQAILQQMIVSAVIAKAADSAGVTVTDGEVAAARDQALDSVREPAEEADVSPRAYLSRQLSDSQGGAVVPPDQLEQFIRDQLLASKLGENDPAAANEALVAASRETDVRVNPRYGRWDPQQGLAPLVSGGLSHTVEELSGGAASAQ